MKYDYKSLVLFCKEYDIILLKDYSKEKINRNTIIEGKCIFSEGQTDDTEVKNEFLETKCREHFMKTFRQLKITRGYCPFHTKKNKKEKF
jgi:hypothetical protein